MSRANVGNVPQADHQWRDLGMQYRQKIDGPGRLPAGRKVFIERNQWIAVAAARSFMM
jgi:hypothetical protein